MLDGVEGGEGKHSAMISIPMHLTHVWIYPSEVGARACRWGRVGWSSRDMDDEFVKYKILKNEVVLMMLYRNRWQITNIHSWIH